MYFLYIIIGLKYVTKKKVVQIDLLHQDLHLIHHWEIIFTKKRTKWLGLVLTFHYKAEFASSGCYTGSLSPSTN